MADQQTNDFLRLRKLIAESQARANAAKPAGRVLPPEQVQSPLSPEQLAARDAAELTKQAQMQANAESLKGLQADQAARNDQAAIERGKARANAALQDLQNTKPGTPTRVVGTVEPLPEIGTKPGGSTEALGTKADVQAQAQTQAQEIQAQRAQAAKALEAEAVGPERAVFPEAESVKPAEPIEAAKPGAGAAEKASGFRRVLGVGGEVLGRVVAPAVAGYEALKTIGEGNVERPALWNQKDIESSIANSGVPDWLVRSLSGVAGYGNLAAAKAADTIQHGGEMFGSSNPFLRGAGYVLGAVGAPVVALGDVLGQSWSDVARGVDPANASLYVDRNVFAKRQAQAAEAAKSPVLAKPTPAETRIATMAATGQDFQGNPTGTGRVFAQSEQGAFPQGVLLPETIQAGNDRIRNGLNFATADKTPVLSGGSPGSGLPEYEKLSNSDKIAFNVAKYDEATKAIQDVINLRRTLNGEPQLGEKKQAAFGQGEDTAQAEKKQAEYESAFKQLQDDLRGGRISPRAAAVVMSGLNNVYGESLGRQSLERIHHGQNMTTLQATEDKGNAAAQRVAQNLLNQESLLKAKADARGMKPDHYTVEDGITFAVYVDSATGDTWKKPVLEQGASPNAVLPSGKI